MSQQIKQDSIIPLYNKIIIKRFISKIATKIQSQQFNSLIRLKQHSFSLSPIFQQQRLQQFVSILHHVYQNKQRQYFQLLLLNIKKHCIFKIQQKISYIKSKDKGYENKVKSLRGLIKQLKQKKSTESYKNKYFTDKNNQNSNINDKLITVRSIVSTLQYMNNRRLFTAFKSIKSTQYIKIKQTKTVYLLNYLQHLRQSKLSYSLSRLKQNILINRQQKHIQQILQLQKKLQLPLSDPQVQSIKQKQQKLQSVLNNVLLQKNKSQSQIDKQLKDIHNHRNILQQQLATIKHQHQQLNKSYQQTKFKLGNYQFNKNQIYYLVMINFLIHLKLWSQFQQNQSIQINKTILLDWITNLNLDFYLDMVHYTQQQIQSYIKQLIKLQQHYLQYYTDANISIEYLLEIHLSNKSLTLSTNSIEEFNNKNKVNYKILATVLQQNNHIIKEIQSNIKNQYDNLIKEIQQGEQQYY